MDSAQTAGFAIKISSPLFGSTNSFRICSLVSASETDICSTGVEPVITFAFNPSAFNDFSIRPIVPKKFDHITTFSPCFFKSFRKVSRYSSFAGRSYSS